MVRSVNMNETMNETVSLGGRRVPGFALGEQAPSSPRFSEGVQVGWSALGGAVTGAIVGTVVGAIASAPGRGAIIGTGVGGLFGGIAGDLSWRSEKEAAIASTSKP